MTKKIVTDTKYIPKPIKNFEYWVIWDFEVKQPRAPWLNDHCYPSDWRQDSDVNPRTDYNQASAAANLGAEFLHDNYPFPDENIPEKVGPTLLLPHEGKDTPGPDPANPPLLFIDYDDVIVDGEIPTEVWDTAKTIGGPLFVSRSYNDPTEDTAGLHQLAWGTLPGQVTTVNAEFETRGHIEVYYRSRMTGFTWQHVRGTPTDELPNATDAIAQLIDDYGDAKAKRRASNTEPSQSVSEIDTGIPPEELDGDTTADIEDIFRAIREVGASDIRLDSRLTEDTGTRKSYNPSWESSKSGTRLGYDSLTSGDGWIYRKANQPVDALQVVAREERITTDITDYPEGKAFWQAVQSLRDRGATIPYYEGKNGTHPDVLQLHQEPDTTDDKRKQALRAMRASKRA